MLENIRHYIPEKFTARMSGNTALFEVPADEIVDVVTKLYAVHSLSLKMITAADERNEHGCFKIFYVFFAPEERAFIVPFIALRNREEFPSCAPVIHKAWNYERKIKTFFGLTPVGHPDPRPLILHENWPADVFPLRKDFNGKERPPRAHGRYDFQRVEGEGVYEIPVGPIHAGIIEPGHFRFNVAGEEILSLEPRLGFVHKGTEKLFETLPLEKKIRLSGKISGDSSFSHSLAFCQAIERLGGVKAAERSKYLRVVYAELERLANHFGDIGAIMLDTGFNFGGANGGRLREMVMQINERLTGSRFLRMVNVIGGVSRDITKEEKGKLIEELRRIINDFSQVIDVAENSASLLNRLKDTGVVSHEVARDHGATGVAAKAAGIAHDVRADHPYAAYPHCDLAVATGKEGDVNARFYVRIKEVYSSYKLIKEALEKLPGGSDTVTAGGGFSLEKNAVVVSMVEGWRGEIVYVVMTDGQGDISRVDVRDPSFLNWSLIEHAGPGNIVPDFPLINKSFNLSYSGNDL
ncbi:NADH-quinone oxidoreductase subunit C [Candidatus Azambacteria bacterium]|nr:NADH-quinone oxidoreductase subunit C [Candidatus Azambacteria bacterium]